MAEREDNVYKAKLAEQAERYDGMKCRLKRLLSMFLKETLGLQKWSLP
jgi:hypothetical protein